MKTGYPHRRSDVFSKVKSAAKKAVPAKTVTYKKKATPAATSAAGNKMRNRPSYKMSKTPSNGRGVGY